MDGRNRWTIFFKEGNLNNNVNPLKKHIEYFSGTKPNQPISMASIAKKNQDLGDAPCPAWTKAGLISFAGGLKVKNCPFLTFTSSEAIGVLNHPNHTGIYKQNGEIDEEVWNELCTYAVDTEFDQGAEFIISQTQLEKFLTARRKQENNPDTFSIAVSNAEWRSYWQIFGKNFVNGEKYVTLNELRQFFVDSSIPGQEVERSVKHGI